LAFRNEAQIGKLEFTAWQPLPPDQEYLPIFTPEGLKEVTVEENKRRCRHETVEHLSLGARKA
jgi:hypothetical protein